jgi:hypothetical protein
VHRQLHLSESRQDCAEGFVLPPGHALYVGRLPLSVADPDPEFLPPDLDPALVNNLFKIRF